MKRFFEVILVLTIVGAFFSCASTGESEISTEALMYNEVVEIAGVSSADLFAKTNMWFVDAFKNADSVIQYSDKEAGIIKGKYVFFIGSGMTENRYTITSTITVEVKDEKYRVSFSDPLSSQTWSAWNGKNVDSSQKAIHDKDLLTKIQHEWKDMARRLKETMMSTTNEW